MFNNTKIRRSLSSLTEIHFYSFDSFRIRIPFHLVEILESRLIDFVYLVSGDGEELDKFKETSYKVHKTGFNFNFRIDKLLNGNKGETNKFVVVLINSKMIEQRYFEGIQAGNISIIYTMIMKLGVINCSFETFMDSHVTDLDVKIDHKAEKEIFISTIDELKQMVIPSQKNYVGCNWFKRADNAGIEFNTRERATPSSPYFKIYHKETELKERSKIFADKYLSEIDFHNVIRFEYTLKNAKMMKDYGIKETKLKDLIKTPQEEFKRLHEIYLKKNFQVRTRVMKKDGKSLATMDSIVATMMKRILKDVTIEVLKKEVLDDFECRMSKSRANKKIDEIYHLCIQPNYKFEKSEKMGEIMGFIGAGNKGFFLDDLSDLEKVP